MDEKLKCALTSNQSNQYFLEEAKIRWLRPSEICEIIRNHHRFDLTPDSPNRPPSGSLFLFDRKALRYFRRDGHCWRKKKDGRTVKEAHIKLKIGNVDALHCYYAHGEDNKDFQRRTYWLLDEQLDHIVLVHYRYLSEGSRFLSQTDSAMSVQSDQASSAAFSVHLSSSNFAIEASYATSPNTANCKGRAPSDFEEADYGVDAGGISAADSLPFASFCGNEVAENNVAGCTSSFSHQHASGLTGPASLGSFRETLFGRHIGASAWPEILRLNKNIGSAHEEKILFEEPNFSDGSTRRMADSSSDSCMGVKLHNGLSDGHSQSFAVDAKMQVQAKVENPIPGSSHLSGNHMIDDSAHTSQIAYDQHFHIAPQFKNNIVSQPTIATIDLTPEYKSDISFASKDAVESDDCPRERGELNKLDSFGRWMNREIGKDCDDSLTSSMSGSYWNSLDAQSGDKDIPALGRHMHLDVDPLGPSLSQEQLFSILDFSPDWAYAGVETKVLISGIFMGGIDPTSSKWCCMFGEYEVSAEVLTANAIRCQAPAHVPGRVPFYVTCCNRLACSEVREFEFRDNIPRGILALKSIRKEDICFQVRFAKMLSLGADRKRLVCFVKDCCKCDLKDSLFSMLSNDETERDKIEDSRTLQGHNSHPKDALIQKLLKDMLYEWLVCKAHEDGKGPNVLDEEGQGVIHLAAALGYQWAMRPTVVAGVNPSFRDARGWTALHWAAYYGREEAVVALVRLGTAPGAVEDPTSKYPEGQTAADVASIRGHKGIAGYLAESDLTSHLSKLALEENVMETVSANLAAEKAVETVQGRNVIPLDGDKGEQISLRRTLCAVRNSALAAARIQASLRSQSFCERLLTKCEDEISGIPDEILMISSLNKKDHRLNHFSDYLHTAAAKIQHRYRGHQGHKNFLKMQNHIVNIQAHVRGHQVRSRYKKIVWSVSIVEKAILRWKRKRPGLRGFRGEVAIGAAGQEVRKTEEYEFLHLGRQQKMAGTAKALARVQSMARNPEAREQFMRLTACSQKSKLADEGSFPGPSSNFRRAKYG